MSVSLFNAIPVGAIEVLTDATGAPHFKRADLGRYLKIPDIKTTYRGVATKSRLELSEPKVFSKHLLLQRRNKQDAFVDLEGALEIVVRSRKPKAVELVKWLTRKGVKKVAEEHQKAIEEKQKAIDEKDMQIEEKDMQLALLNDDLTITQQNVVVLEQDNLELQSEVERLKTRAVPHLEDPKKDNGIVVIQKNNGDSYQYLAICGQQGYVAQKIKNKLVDYPNGQIVVLGETPNAVIYYNWLRERGCIVVNPDRVRHFRLGENYSHQRLIELQDA